MLRIYAGQGRYAGSRGAPVNRGRPEIGPDYAVSGCAGSVATPALADRSRFRGYSKGTEECIDILSRFDSSRHHDKHLI